MYPRRILALLVAIAFIVVAACSGSSSSKTATPDVSTPPTGAVSTNGASSSSNPATLREDSGLSAVDIVKKLAPSVVRVQTEGATIDIFGRAAPTGGDRERHEWTYPWLGTGSPAQNITVTLNDQRTATATIVGRDEPTDLAVLKIDAQNLTPATIGDSSKLEVGQDVLAIGFALDLKGAPTVTRGVVSATGRSIDESPYTINDAIQTDSGINPGNSGGPLVNAAGEVVGIDTAIIQGAQSIGFAISSALVQPTVQSLISAGKIDRALGMPVLMACAEGGGTPAAQAGLRENDVIVNVDGQDVSNSGDLLAVLAKHRAADRVSVVYYRGSDKRTTDVTLASRPNS